MPSRRIQRLNEQLKREIADIIRRELRDPRVGVVTVTGVEATRDLSYATVYVRPMGDDEAKTEALEGLRTAAPHIRHQLGQTLRIRHVPELRFERDETLEQALRIEKILQEVRPDEGWDQEPEGEGEEGEGTE